MTTSASGLGTKAFSSRLQSIRVMVLFGYRILSVILSVSTRHVLSEILRCAVVVACLAHPIPVAAQVLAAISGVITDPSGAAIAGAEVSAKQVDTGAIRETTTDAAGRYRL